MRPSLPCGACGTGFWGPRRGWTPVTSTQSPMHASKNPHTRGSHCQEVAVAKAWAASVAGVGPSSHRLPAHSATPAASVQPQPLKLASVCADKVGPQFTFALDIDQPAALAGITQSPEDGARLLRHLKRQEAAVSEAEASRGAGPGGGRQRARCTLGGPWGHAVAGRPLAPGKPCPPWSRCPQVGPHLDFPELSSALHPAGDVDRVPPDVVLRLPRPDHARDHGPVVYAWGRRSRLAGHRGEASGPCPGGGQRPTRGHRKP